MATSAPSITSIINRTVAKYSSNRFQATAVQRQAKSAFWSHFFSNGETAPETVEPAVAARYSGYNEVLEWWGIPGFSEWFSNGEEFRQRVEYVSNLALDVLQAVLQDDMAPSKDRLQAAKMALEVASKFPNRGATDAKFADARIGEMDRKQLEEFISSKLRTTSITPPVAEPVTSSHTGD